MRKIIITLISILLFILIFTVLPLSKPVSSALANGDRQEVNISAKEINTSNDYIKITVKIPVINGLKNGSLQKRLNDMIENDMNSFSENIEKQAKQDYDYASKHNSHFNPYEVYIDYEVPFNNGKILSILATYYNYTGGAHGMTVLVPFNFDLGKGVRISLKDLFNENYDYNVMIRNEVLRAVKADPDNYFGGAAETILSYNIENNFYIQNCNLVVYYGLYEIAPYAGGIKRFNIPFSVFGSGIKKGLI